MNRLFFVVPLLSASALSCATRRDTGAAMIMTGAAAAVIGGQSAGSTYCHGPGMCYTRRASKAGAAVAAAGMALAIAGHALAESQKGDHIPSRVKPDYAPKDWRLRRPDSPEEPVGSSTCTPESTSQDDMPRGAPAAPDAPTTDSPQVPATSVSKPPSGEAAGTSTNAAPTSAPRAAPSGDSETTSAPSPCKRSAAAGAATAPPSAAE